MSICAFSLQITSGVEGAKQPAILQIECQKMTFKLKSVLQRQCCNGWTEFRGCVLQGDLSHACQQAGGMVLLHLSGLTNRARHLLYSVLFL